MKTSKFIITICLWLTIQIANITAVHSLNKRLVPPLLIFPPTAPTRVQLIFGIGIPEGDLNYESLTNGWVLKYEYFLPSNATQLYVPAKLNIAGRSIPDVDSKNEKYQEEAIQIDTGFTGADDWDSKDEKEFTGDNSSKGENSISDYDEIDTEFDEPTENRLAEKKNLSKYRWAFYKALEAAADRKGLSGRSCVLKSICETAALPFHYQNGLLAELIHILLTPSASVDELSSHTDNVYFQAEVLGKSGAPCQAVFKECNKSLLDIFTNVLDVSDNLLNVFL